MGRLAMVGHDKLLTRLALIRPLLGTNAKYVFDSALLFPEKVPPKKSDSNPLLRDGKLTRDLYRPTSVFRS